MTKTVTLALLTGTKARPALARNEALHGWTGVHAGYGAPDTDTPLVEMSQSVRVRIRTLLQERDRRTLGEALVNVSGVSCPRGARRGGGGGPCL